MKWPQTTGSASPIAMVVEPIHVELVFSAFHGYSISPALTQCLSMTVLPCDNRKDVKSGVGSTRRPTMKLVEASSTLKMGTRSNQIEDPDL